MSEFDPLGMRSSNVDDSWDAFSNGAAQNTSGNSAAASTASFSDFGDFSFVGAKVVGAQSAAPAAAPVSAPTPRSSDELAAAKSRINKLMSEQIALQRTHDGAVLALKDAHEEELKNLTAEFAAVQEKRKKLFIDLKEKYQEASAAAAAAQSQVEAARAALRERDAALAESAAAIKKRDENSAKREQMYANSAAEISRLTSELEAAKSANSVLTSEVRAKEKSASAASTYQAQLEVSLAALSDREATLRERDETIAERDDMIEYNGKELARLRAELDNVKRTSAATVSALNKRIAELEKGKTTVTEEEDEWAIPSVPVKPSTAAPVSYEQTVSPPMRQPHFEPAAVAAAALPVEHPSVTVAQPLAMSFDDFESDDPIAAFEQAAVAAPSQPQPPIEESFDESSLSFDQPEASREGAVAELAPVAAPVAAPVTTSAAAATDNDKVKGADGEGSNGESLEEQSRRLSLKCSISVEAPANVEGQSQSPVAGKFESSRVIVFKWSLAGDVRIKWFRSFGGGVWEQIPGKTATRPKYTLTVDDIGATMKATATPASGTGPSVYCERGTVTASNSLLNGLAKAISKFDVVFDVQSVEKEGTAAAADSQRQIALNKEKIKLRTTNKTIAKAVYSAAVRATIDGDSTNKFFLTIEPNGPKAHFATPSSRERDYIVQCIRLFTLAIVNPKQFSVKPGAPTEVVVALAKDSIVQLNATAAKNRRTSSTPKNKVASPKSASVSSASANESTPKAANAGTPKTPATPGKTPNK